MALQAILAGAIMLNAWAISVFFFRFWRKTRDPLFGFFCAGFFLLGIERISLVAMTGEGAIYAYLIRLLAFLLLAWGVVAKNFRANRR